MQKENTNAALLPSCPSDGWATLEPLTPRNGYQWTPGVCDTPGGVDTCPHDNHYYGPCGTIPANLKDQTASGIAANFGSEFGWPSADIYTVSATITPEGDGWLQYEDGGQQGASPFLNYRSQIKNPDWTVESMLYANSTLVKEFPSLLSAEDNGTAAGLERWLYLTQALQAHCVGGSVATYRQHQEVMGSLNWAINSIWIGPAWGSISHDGSWKMLHYRLRHLFKSVLLSFVDVLPSPAPAPPAPPAPPRPTGPCKIAPKCMEGVASTLGWYTTHDPLKTSCEQKWSQAVVANTGLGVHRHCDKTLGAGGARAFLAPAWQKCAAAVIKAGEANNVSVCPQPAIWTPPPPPSPKDAGAVSSNHLCAPGHTCLHVSNHNPEAVTIPSDCSLHVRSFATGGSKLTENFGVKNVAGVGGAIVATFDTADLLSRARCGVGECWLSSTCPESLHVSKLEAQPNFPGKLANAKLVPAGLAVSVMIGAGTLDLSITANTTAPYVFISSELPGTFSDNSMTLIPGQATNLSFVSAKGAKPVTEAEFRKATRVYTMNNVAPQHLTPAASELKAGKVRAGNDTLWPL